MIVNIFYYSFIFSQFIHLQYSFNPIHFQYKSLINKNKILINNVFIINPKINESVLINNENILLFSRDNYLIIKNIQQSIKNDNCKEIEQQLITGNVDINDYTNNKITENNYISLIEFIEHFYYFLIFWFLWNIIRH